MLDGYAFKWLKASDGGPGFWLDGTFRYTKSEVIREMEKHGAWAKIYREGGRVVPVRLVEVEGAV